jgi:GNAT superfamily N-acetyltransferase
MGRAPTETFGRSNRIYRLPKVSVEARNVVGGGRRVALPSSAVTTTPSPTTSIADTSATARAERPTIRNFEPDDVAPAGRLLAARQAEHRRHEPLLAARFEDPDVAAAEVAAAAEDGATGAVAVLGDDVMGYLLGGPKTSPTWGANTWVETAGQALRSGLDPEVVRDLYAHAAASWVAAGRDVHYVLVPAYDAALVDAWFRLGFGQQHVHAVREIEPLPTRVPAGLLVRPARREDIPVLAQLDVELPQHQGRAPTFSAGQVPTYDESLADWEEAIDDTGYAHFVVEHDGFVVGAATGCALERSGTNLGLTRPDHAGFLGFASVLPAARGLGAGRALGEAVHSWAADAGFTSLATDWRATNLLSSRTWPRLGYRPTFLRLHRRLGY